MSAETVRIRLEPLSTTVEVPWNSSLKSALCVHGVEFPCGGIGICGGCRFRVLAGELPVTGQDVAVFSAIELGDGWRLACQARAESSLVLECSQWKMDVLTDDSGLSTAGKSGLELPSIWARPLLPRS